MIDTKTIITYAQYNEDIILAALFPDVKKGFYVDVGANDPILDSVTNYFYKKGWRGINIEPIKELYEALVTERPKDTNLQYGVGEKNGTVVFREYTSMPGHSTFDSDQRGNNEGLEYKDYEVAIKPLVDIFKEQKVTHIHFLKVDVEGFEYEVIAGNDWTKYKPEVLCIESNHTVRDWRKTILKNGYKLFISDGLNDYYVHESSWQRTDDFAERAVSLDYHALKRHHWEPWNNDIEQLDRHVKLFALQQKEMERLQLSNQKLERQTGLTLKDQTFGRRLKRAVYGLTVDWVKYKYRKTQSKK